MSDVTRQPGGDPAGRDPHTPDTRGGTAPGGPGADQGAGIRADHAVGAREDVTPGLGTGTTGTAGAPAPHTGTSHGVHAAPGTGTGTDGGHGTQGVGTSHGVHATPGTGTGTDGGHGTQGVGTSHGSHGAHGGAGGLLPHEECDRLGQRLHHAVAEFVDAPRASVEEADRVLEELAARFADAVTHRRRALRTSWQDTGEETRATSTDTEQLRLALKDYRELADRLMHV